MSCSNIGAWRIPSQFARNASQSEAPEFWYEAQVICPVTEKFIQNLITKDLPSAISVSGFKGTPMGRGPTFAASSNRIDLKEPVKLNAATTDVTMAVVHRPRETFTESGTPGRVFAWGNSQNNPAFHIGYHSTNQHYSLRAESSSAGRLILNAANNSSPLNNDYVALVRRTDQAGKDYDLWVNGIRMAGQGVAGNIANKGDPLKIGNGFGNARGAEGEILAVYVWTYYMPSTLILKLAQDPFAPMRIRKDKAFIVPSAPPGGNDGAAMYHHLQNLGAY